MPKRGLPEDFDDDEGPMIQINPNTGEEILVIEGTRTDEDGNEHRETYVENKKTGEWEKKK